MNDVEAIFDQADEVLEAAALALAREEIASGKGVPHEVVGAWLRRLANGEAGLAPPID